MIKLVASDLDGTIIDSNNKIYKNNFDAIKTINQNDIDFVICTGKTYPITKGLYSAIDAKYGIFGDGNQIINLRTGEEIYKRLLSKEEVNICLDIARAHNLHVHLYTDKELITEQLLYMDLRNYNLSKSSKSELEIKIISDIKRYINLNDVNIFTLVISSMESLSDVKKDILEQADVSVTTIGKRGKYKDKVIGKEYEYLSITPKGVSKSAALGILGSYINVDKSEMMAIGDNINDIDMVKDSGVGVAVANAYDELKEVAKYTTENPVENGGFAEAVYKYIEF